MIYFDNSATTPVDERVLNVFDRVCLEYPGNSNSIHSLGVKSKNLEEYATKRIAKILGVKPSEIIYTSGASESNNLAIKGVCGKYDNRGHHIITTMLEHSSISEPLKYLAKHGYEIDYVKITDDGLVDLDNLKSLLRDDTVLVSICAVDSEIGLMQPIKEIGEIVKNYPKCYFHVDCTQAIGKIDVDFTNIDMASFSTHKFFGLKGIGVLVKKENIMIEPLIHGGKSTTTFRSGTPPLPLIVSLMKALDLIYVNIPDNYKYVSELNKVLIAGLKQYKNIHINSTNNSLCYIINFSIHGIKPETLVHALEEYNIFISTKSACSSTNTISDSVYALTKDRQLSMESVRISLSYLNTIEEVKEFLRVFDIVYNKLNM